MRKVTDRHTATPAGSDAYVLGEGPLWDRDRNRLLWVDIMGGEVLAGRLDTATGTIAVTGTWSFGDDLACAVAVAESGDLLVATRDRLVAVRGDGEREVLATAKIDNGRFNDGGVDPQGRYLIGSMALDDRQGTQQLLRLEPAGGWTVLDDDLTLSNGLAWVGDRLYSIDSVPGVVHVRDYPGGERREVMRLDETPDGMCADADGNLWIAIHDGGRIECRSPGGDLLAVVDVPVPQPTSCAFAGPDLDVLVITTATEGLSPDDLARHPDAGHLFTARVGVRGAPTPYWQ